MGLTPKEKLPRLEREWYRGLTTVFWTLTLEDRATGWLNSRFHSTFRELMLHAAYRYRVICPAYCLMPDHGHLIWMGASPDTDQCNAMKFLRTHCEPALGGGRKWQHQPHDHVFRENERQPEAFARTCNYIFANPVRAGLVEHESAWPYSGAVIPGYPDLNPFAPEHWPFFWKIYEKLVS